MSEKTIQKIANVLTIIMAIASLVVLYLAVNGVYEKIASNSDQIADIRNEIVQNEERLSDLEEKVEYLTFGNEPENVVAQVAINRSFRVFEDGTGHLIIQTVGQHQITVEGEFVEFGENGNTGQDTVEYSDDTGSHWISLNPEFDYGIDMNGYNEDSVDY